MEAALVNYDRSVFQGRFVFDWNVSVPGGSVIVHSRGIFKSSRRWDFIRTVSDVVSTGSIYRAETLDYCRVAGRRPGLPPKPIDLLDIEERERRTPIHHVPVPPEAPRTRSWKMAPRRWWIRFFQGQQKPDRHLASVLLGAIDGAMGRAREFFSTG